MARTIRDANLDTKEARSRLKARGKPHYRLIEPGLHLGYRKPRGRKGKPAGAGKWVARHYIGGQSYIVETIGVADDTGDADGFAILSFAQAQVKARERMIKRVHAANGVSGPLTVQAAVEAYIEFLESNRKTAVDARHRAEAFIYPTLGNIEVASLTTDVLRKWHVGLAKTPPRARTKTGEEQQYRAFDGGEEAIRRRQSTANRTLTNLKAALNRMWRDGKVPSDTAWRRVEPFEDVDAARPHYLKVDEAKRLVNACDPEFRPMVQAALETGARYGELCRLRVANFNPDVGKVEIQKSKSGDARHIVLTGEGIALFKQLTAGRSSDELLLHKADGSQWGKSHQARRMAEACKRARINPPVGIHQLRHTWASHAVMNGVPLIVTAKNLGHKDTRMVEKHYGHLRDDYVEDAIRTGAPRFGFRPDAKLATLQPKNR